MAEYRDLPLNDRPKTLDPDEYFNLSVEKRKAEEARVALRANMKRKYQLQLNNPHRTDMIDDPAVTQWVYARTNPYPNFKPTQKTSLLGFVFGVVPLFGFWYLFRKSRDQKEEQVRAGTYKQKFRLD